MITLYRSGAFTMDVDISRPTDDIGVLKFYGAMSDNDVVFVYRKESQKALIDTEDDPIVIPAEDLVKLLKMLHYELSKTQ